MPRLTSGLDRGTRKPASYVAAGARARPAGEGAFDATSRRGKVVGRVLDRAADRDVPVVLVCGRVDAAAPEAVRVVDGAGGIVDAAGLAALARRGVEELPG